MASRILTFAAAVALSTIAAGAAFAEDASINDSTVDRPLASGGQTPADFAATFSPGTVGAMHYAVAGVPTDGGSRQGAATAATVRWTQGAQTGL